MNDRQLTVMFCDLVGSTALSEQPRRYFHRNRDTTPGAALDAAHRVVQALDGLAPIEKFLRVASDVATEELEGRGGAT